MISIIDDMKSCDYCHDEVSIFESITEFGKHYHENCYIHKTQKEIEQYKKKFINNTLTDGDKDDLVDKFNLVQKLKTERTNFKGFSVVGDFQKNTPVMTEKTMLYLGDGVVVKDNDGKPIMMGVPSPTVSFTSFKLRPNVTKTITKTKCKVLTKEDIPGLMENLHD